MPETPPARVAVYLDFDNIVISRYDQVHGRGAFGKDRARGVGPGERGTYAEVARKLEAATVDVGAIIDFAASYGTLVLTRAYADWSAPVNTGYRSQLVGRAVDLVQLFPAAAYAKNGADIRLAVDAVEDMFRLPDLTHVVIVAGDSDYVPLAQRCKRLGRSVIGIGVSGATAKSLAAACDEFYSYDTLPGIEAPTTAPTTPGADAGAGAKGAQAPAEQPAAAPEAEPEKAPARRRSRKPKQDEEPEPEASDPQEDATRLLERALRIGHEKDDDEWLHSSAVKTQMKRMDPSFSEKALGYRSFSDFVKSRPQVAELDESAPQVRLIRLASRARR
ncbi:NYN domain-containing protein [Gryllotalpicola ginsengisoli]|uniref:NYN domain-containing protein n=1 Tax=Gryllotalpicola ginsengisoli TaxID=444608 RepID=UPI0003B31F18|nr:NYN domain-containing protein [Gryllotalpicola ginsengisoli]